MVSFFDCFLKDDDYDGWKTGKEPPVRFAVRKGAAPMGSLDESKVFDWRGETEWPPTRTKYEKLYLQPNKSLHASKPTANITLSYKGLV